MLFAERFTQQDKRLINQNFTLIKKKTSINKNPVYFVHTVYKYDLKHRIKIALGQLKFFFYMYAFIAP